MDTTTAATTVQVLLDQKTIEIDPRDAPPAFATPSPPESCVSDSSEHLPEPPSHAPHSHSCHSTTMQPNRNMEATHAHTHNHNHTHTRNTKEPSSTMSAAEGEVNNSTNLNMYQSTTPSAPVNNTPQHVANENEHKNQHQHNHNMPLLSPHPQGVMMVGGTCSNSSRSDPPPTVAATTTVSSSSNTDFPSLPPRNKISEDSAGVGVGGMLRNKRPTRDRVLRTLSDALMRRSLTMIDLSQRELRPSDATLVKLALLQNSSLSVLKLGYNNLCDEGVATLASGISTHAALTSLDLGFNNIGDEGCIALSSAILSTSRRGGKLHTLYLAGNCIGEEGARALAQVVRYGCGLKRIHLTRNSIGPDGIKELMEAVIDYEVRILRDGYCSVQKATDSTEGKSSSSSPRQNGGYTNPLKVQDNRNNSTYVEQQLPMSIAESLGGGLTELFLGGTYMGHDGCVAVAKMLEQTTSLRVLSLANCELNDTEASILAPAIAKNCKKLPIEKLQLSFNNLTCKGIEALMNAVWSLKNLKELQLDNNQMQARGAQVVAAVLGAVKTLTTLNVGFNKITGSGIKVLMKAVAESKTLTSLTISGNNIDAGSANTVAIALAHNKSLTSLFVDHCSIPSEGQRLMTAGIVSNSNTRLQILTGFRIGSYAKILRLPEALERWTNEQVLSFILLMWKHMRQEQEETIDPLNLLPAVNGDGRPRRALASGPLDAPTVVAVAKRTFEALGPHGEEILSQRSAHSKLSSFESPLAGDVIVVEANGATVPLDHPDSSNGAYDNDGGNINPQLPIPGELIVPKTITKTPTILNQSTRKKKIVKWLCNNMYHLNELSNLPFNDGELWRLHQHFVSPTILETNLHYNGKSCMIVESIEDLNSLNSSAHACSSILSEPCAQSQSSVLSIAPASAPVMRNLSMLKRKVSYRFLHEAALIESPVNPRPDLAVKKLIEDMNGHSMQPKSKRARRNRSRISIVPRIKKKLDSFLVSDHHRALGLMRQLAYVEKSLLNGSIYPVEDVDTATHLIGSLASDAEMILVDMM